MSLLLTAVMIIGGLVSAAVLVVGVPLFFIAMAYDVMQSKGEAVARSADTRVRIAAERGVARSFVLAGGTFWSIASFAGLYSFRESGVGYALLAAFYPLLACLVTLAVGWYYERMVAALLMLASIAVVAWGVIYQFEIGVWLIMTFALIGPMVTAAVLFWLARRDQEAFELAMSFPPDLAPVFSAKSSIDRA